MLVECIRVRPLAKMKATEFLLQQGVLVARLYVPWIELDNAKFPSVLFFVKWEAMEAVLSVASATNQTCVTHA